MGGARRRVMGTGARLGVAAVAALALGPPAPAEAVTQAEPIARLSLEGGYDSNVLLDGDSADRTGKVSPEVGLRLRDRRWDLAAVYGADYVVYQRLASDGVLNHRGSLELEAIPGRRLEVAGALRGAYAYDPVGLAQAGIFRTERQSAFLLRGSARVDWEAMHRLILAAALSEQVVMFEDDTGGAMHAPSVDALWRRSRRLSVGGAYALSLFQDFGGDGTDLAVAHALRARARYRASRALMVDAFVGPALWSGPDGTSLVPEAAAELRVTKRRWELRGGIAHRLGIGTTAAPGLVDSFELGAIRRFGRRFELRGEGGLWRSGEAPTGRNATLGYALSGEAGVHFGAGVRVAITGSRFARLDDDSAALRRTTVGLRLSWELPAR